MLVRKAVTERIAHTLGRVCGHRFADDVRFTAPEPVVAEKAPVRMLFADGYAMSTLMLWVTYFMGLLIIYLLTGWLPTLIKDAGLPVERAAAITGMFQLGGTIGAVAVGFAMDRMDRNVVIGFSYLLGGVFIFALGMGTLQSGTLPALVACAGFFMSGAQTGLNALAPSCYPTRARATGVSWMLGFGRWDSGFAGGRGIALAGLQLCDRVLGARRARRDRRHCDRDEPRCVALHHESGRRCLKSIREVRRWRCAVGFRSTRRLNRHEETRDGWQLQH
jgi:hypothetical protein